MATIFPEIITDGTGRTWTWSEAWQGYRADGMAAHGYDTIKAQWGISPEPDVAGAYLEEHAYDSFPTPVPFWIVRCNHPSHGPIALNSGHHYRAEVKHHAELLIIRHNNQEHRENEMMQQKKAEDLEHNDVIIDPEGNEATVIRLRRMDHRRGRLETDLGVAVVGLNEKFTVL